jgi:hypothetical protein
MIVERSRFILRYAFILTVSFTLLIINTPAYSIDFVAEEDFAADKSSYKDFPLRLLFQKLAESDDTEKKEITNFIILKQVFDPNTQEKDTANVLEYEESFGIIEEVDETSLKLWDPGTDSYKEYFIGIDRIPTEKSSEYEINETNIGKCASVIYSLDNRIYKIKIDFMLTAPSNLYVERKGDQNIVGWSEALIDRKPDAYRLFLNGELFDTVEGTVANVPRERGKVDSYFVKAVYKRGDALIESEPSDTVRDEITAAELQQEFLANQTYDRIIAALNPEEYETAKKLLYDNRQILLEYLSERPMNVIEKLLAFFGDIDEGDRLSSETPLTLSDMDNALASYSKGAEKADDLSDTVSIAFISTQRIKEALELKAQLETRERRLLARERYDEVIVSLTPEDWEKGKELLIDNRQFFSEYLDDYLKESTERLMEFFQDIEEGDILSAERPETEEGLDNALVIYKRAEQRSKDFPDTINVSFIAEQKIDTCQGRITMLAEAKQKELAALEAARLKKLAEEEARQKELAALEEARKRKLAEEEATRQEEITAAREAKIASKEPPKKVMTEEMTGQEGLPEGYDRDSMIQLALKNFDDADYESSWNNFLKMFKEPIDRIRQGGNNQIRGVLALPVECRAEIFFLIELDELKNSIDGEGITENGLEEIRDRIENREGFWVIIGDSSERRKIRRHISRFDFDSFK